MFAFLTVAALSTGLSLYPAFGDLSVGIPRTGSHGVLVNHIKDKGPIVELILGCSRGEAIVTYSKLERVFCGPRGACERSLAPIAARVCR